VAQEAVWSSPLPSRSYCGRRLSRPQGDPRCPTCCTCEAVGPATLWLSSYGMDPGAMTITVLLFEATKIWAVATQQKLTGSIP
jgi:hypothetical protein